MSTGTKPKVITRCVANHYARDDERIVEISDSVLGIGCLISIRRTPEGALQIAPYRADKGVVFVCNGNELPEFAKW